MLYYTNTHYLLYYAIHFYTILGHRSRIHVWSTSYSTVRQGSSSTRDPLLLNLVAVAAAAIVVIVVVMVAAAVLCILK